MQDARLGIVRLPLPDGREVALQVTFSALDAHGHDWMIEQFKTLQKGKAGVSTALGDLIEVLSAGAITKAEILAAPMAAYPLHPCLRACWDAWELAQYGPTGRSAEAGPENPQNRRPTPWSRLFGRRSARG